MIVRVNSDHYSQSLLPITPKSSTVRFDSPIATSFFETWILAVATFREEEPSEPGANRLLSMNDLDDAIVG
jgi:hypothetical protein